MKRTNLWTVAALVLGLLVVAVPQAQTVLTTTTLSAAITGFPDTAQRTVTVAAATGMTANTTALFLPATGEYMPITNVSGTVISVIRGAEGTRAWPAASGATVIVAQAGSAVQYTPLGPCTRGSGLARFQPVINTRTGDYAVCRLAGAWAVVNEQAFTANSTTKTP